DNRTVVHLVPPNVQKEGCPFVERTAQIPAVFLKQKRRFLFRIRIARIPEMMGEVIEDRAPKLVCPGFGENLYAAHAESVIFGRERVLVDPYLADGFLRRELPSAESIYEYRAAAGPG